MQKYLKLKNILKLLKNVILNFSKKLLLIIMK